MPTRRPRYSAPCAWAASSTTRSRCRRSLGDRPAPGAEPAGMPRAEVLRQRALKRLALRAESEQARLQHLADGAIQIGLVRQVLALQLNDRDSHSGPPASTGTRR